MYTVLPLKKKKRLSLYLYIIKKEKKKILYTSSLHWRDDRICYLKNGMISKDYYIPLNTSFHSNKKEIISNACSKMYNDKQQRKVNHLFLKCLCTEF